MTSTHARLSPNRYTRAGSRQVAFVRVHPIQPRTQRAFPTRVSTNQPHLYHFDMTNLKSKSKTKSPTALRKSLLLFQRGAAIMAKATPINKTTNKRTIQLDHHSFWIETMPATNANANRPNATEWDGFQTIFSDNFIRSASSMRMTPNGIRSFRNRLNFL